ncbi:MAG: hypothetical protein AVDCRST_MAG66-2110 [uncultured Pseudonocardia sp.]|uniref:Uncharacterized protein n=1 Tax=uncultured Pseudonocardia sp. TaxID=211455 RepID=A0A6J4PCP9_9PSEU|nr:MAG: hypothetical protein AVDCRST_MAG66-2110 [uncultured Pseudonocardia sp.]
MPHRPGAAPAARAQHAVAGTTCRNRAPGASGVAARNDP